MGGMRIPPEIVKSIQRGTLSFAAGVDTTKTATITAVDTGKSFVLPGGGIIDADADDTGTWHHIVLTNSTTVTATRNSNTNNLTVAYQVVEFW